MLGIQQNKIVVLVGKELLIYWGYLYKWLHKNVNIFLQCLTPKSFTDRSTWCEESWGTELGKNRAAQFICDHLTLRTFKIQLFRNLKLVKAWHSVQTFHIFQVAPSAADKDIYKLDFHYDSTNCLLNPYIWCSSIHPFYPLLPFCVKGVSLVPISTSHCGRDIQDTSQVHHWTNLR